MQNTAFRQIDLQKLVYRKLKKAYGKILDNINFTRKRSSSIRTHESLEKSLAGPTQAWLGLARPTQA